jgi:hypothetical protein
MDLTVGALPEKLASPLQAARPVSNITSAAESIILFFDSFIMSYQVKNFASIYDDHNTYRNDILGS